MDGDVAPLAGAVELARRHRCRLMVDEAHATGCLGPDGRGSVAAAGLTGEVDVIVGTLGKALGGYGAYVCASRRADRLPRQLGPAVHLLDRAAAPGGRRRPRRARGPPERPKRVERLRANAAALRSGLRGEGLEPAGSETQIVPLVIGEADDAMALCERLLAEGVFAQAIRPPTVPPGTCRLRLTVMASHAIGDLRRAARSIGAAARQLGLAPEPRAMAAALRQAA